MTNRSNHIAFMITAAGTAFAFGLMLPLWDSGNEGVLSAVRIGGMMLIASGLFLLTSPRRRLIKQDRDLPRGVEDMVLKRMRLMGATGILMGVGQWIPSGFLQVAVLLCAATVSLAGVFKVPRRFFLAKGSAD